MSIVRPRSVGIIGWINILLGTFSLLSILTISAMEKMPEYQDLIKEYSLSSKRLPEQLAVIGSLYLVCGVSILKGFNWGRLLYFWSIGLLSGAAIIVNGFSRNIIPSIIIYLVFVLFLTKPEIKEFFMVSKVKTPRDKSRGFFSV